MPTDIRLTHSCVEIVFGGHEFVASISFVFPRPSGKEFAPQDRPGQEISRRPLSQIRSRRELKAVPPGWSDPGGLEEGAGMQTGEKPPPDLTIRSPSLPISNSRC